MNKDKHVLPGDPDTFRDRVRREASKQGRQDGSNTIYGPDNETLAKVNVKKGR